jgi:hypothetical protein
MTTNPHEDEKEEMPKRQFKAREDLEIEIEVEDFLGETKQCEESDEEKRSS